MNLFKRLRNFSFQRGPGMRESDRMWLEKQFLKLIKAYGYPEHGQYSLSPHFFPFTFKEKDIKIENVISDCLNLLDMEDAEVEYEIFEDVRESENLMIGNNGSARASFVDFDRRDNVFRLELAGVVLTHPIRTIVTTCFEMCRAKLLQGGDWVRDWEDSDLLTFLASLHFGFGLIIGPNLDENSELSQSIFQEGWGIYLGFPSSLMSYAFAIFAWLRKDLNPKWKKGLHVDLRREFSRGIAHLSSRPDYFDAAKLEYSASLEEKMELASNLYDKGKYEQAIELLEELSRVEDFPGDRSILFNNLGYYKMRLLSFESAIVDLHQAIELDPKFGYALDNLGLCYIHVGELEKGKSYLELALRSSTNDRAYTLRNMGIYNHKLGKMEIAKDFFHEAYSKGTEVDLLDYYYGQFLISYGELEKGKKHIALSAEAGEREGIKLLKKIKGN